MKPSGEMNGVGKLELCVCAPLRRSFQNVEVDLDYFERRSRREKGFVRLLEGQVLILQWLDQNFGQRQFTRDGDNLASVYRRHQRAYLVEVSGKPFDGVDNDVCIEINP